jgi:hypothetical protein
VNLLLLGMNHRTAPLALREHYAIDDVEPALSKLVDRDVITEAVLLSTCNRVEAMVCAPRLEIARLRLRSFFERDLAHGPPPGPLRSRTRSTSSRGPRRCATCSAWRRPSIPWWWASPRSSAR